MFTWRTTVRMYDTDALQIIFFAHLFRYAADAMEELYTDAGISMRDQLGRLPWITPIVHSEADYRRPLRIGDELVIGLVCERISAKSFTMRFTVTRRSEDVAGGKLIYACIDRASFTGIPLPDELRTVLERHQ